MLPLGFGIGALGLLSLGYQVVTALQQAGAAGGGKAFAQVFQLADHGVQQGGPVVEQVAQLGLFLAQFLEFLAQAVLFEAGEAAQGHGQHGIGLAFAQPQPHLQAGPGRGGIPGRLDHFNHLSEGIKGLDQAFHHLQPIFRAFERMAGAPHDC